MRAPSCCLSAGGEGNESLCDVRHVGDRGSMGSCRCWCDDVGGRLRRAESFLSVTRSMLDKRRRISIRKELGPSLYLVLGGDGGNSNGVLPEEISQGLARLELHEG